MPSSEHMIGITAQDLKKLLPSFSKVFKDFYAPPESFSCTTDPFTINAETGFLPTAEPVTTLAAPFHQVSTILNRMPVSLEDGTPGLLATYSLGPLIDSGDNLNDLTECIDTLIVEGTNKHNLNMITALFRDYSFLASAYLLEPCWKTHNERHARTASASNQGCPHSLGKAEYGFGRSRLPAAIARPLVKLASILDIPPFMSYAASYALYNYRLVNPNGGVDDYDNLRLIRAFEKGLDPKSSEAGFILTHVHMVAKTGPLIAGVVESLTEVEKHKSTVSERPNGSSTLSGEGLVVSLSKILTTMSDIEASMERMWSNSLPKDYPTYRTFIFGITSQPLFPHGVVYEGCFNDQPQYFRGESGANDSIIPLLDNLCQIPMPTNPLTETLKEFRGYRPKQHRELLTWVETKAAQLDTREFLTKYGGLDVAVLYLRVLDHVRSFRWRHWMFAREYIIKQSKYPVATGGSPIVTWLPNQLSAVLSTMEWVHEHSGLKSAMEGEEGCLSASDIKLVKCLMDNVVIQKDKLRKEVDKYCQERGV